jgi:hypothetical protein
MAIDECLKIQTVLAFYAAHHPLIGHDRHLKKATDTGIFTTKSILVVNKIIVKSLLTILTVFLLNGI